MKTFELLNIIIWLMAKMILFQNNLNKSLILTHLLKEIMIGLKKNNLNSNRDK
jgi:hypothetical protein